MCFLKINIILKIVAISYFLKHVIKLYLCFVYVDVFFLLCFVHIWKKNLIIKSVKEKNIHKLNIFNEF